MAVSCWCRDGGGHGAGIGGGNQGAGGTVTVDGGTVTATGGKIVITIPVDSQSGFMILQSGDASVPTEEAAACPR